MILYNMRYRGPLEYDKFVLNTLQFYNEVSVMLQTEFGSGNEDSLAAIQSEVNSVLELIIGNASTNPLTKIVGLSEQLYYNMLNLEEC